MTERRWYRDPLIGLLLAGSLLYGLYALVRPDDDTTRIVVDRAGLLDYVQYRQRRFDSTAAAAGLDALTATELAQLIDDYVREEALVRHARSLGLHETDFVIRQRLLQKVEFVARGVGEVLPEPGDGELEAWYSARKDDYRRDATASFVHVFVAAGEDFASSQERAAALLAELNAQGVSAQEAAALGDRFPYHGRYAQRAPAEIAAHFGDAFAAAVTGLSPDAARWQGPLESRHGHHLLLLTAARPAHTPAFTEVADEVAYDWRKAAEAARLDALTREIVEQYRVVVADDLGRQ
ncbi:MAG: peptidylprolyl isomerase [Pseudomonadota bacterium]